MVDVHSPPATVTPTPSLPLSLQIVGWLTILYGVGSVINIVGLALHGHFFLDISALQLFSGIGILRLIRGWRIYQLVCLWLGLLLLGFAAISALTSGHRMNFGWLGMTLDHAPRESLLFLFLALTMVSIWEIRVLTRPDVRKLFGISET